MRRTFALSVAALLGGVSLAAASPDAPVPESLPVREVTVFKDGHAMILRRGEAPTDANGDVTFGDLPHPILGTFWAWEDEPGAELRSVSAGREEITRTRSARTMAELIEANIGAEVRWDGQPGVIEGVLTDLAEAPGARPLPAETPRPRTWWGYSAPTPAWAPPEPERPPGDKTVLIRLLDGRGTVAVPMASLQEQFTFGADPRRAMFEERAEADRLTMHLAWEGAPSAQAKVGMMYVERGLRWIPTYKLTILDENTVRLELQATLINEIADLHDVTANLVVGVPSFAFENTPDPMGLQEFLADLGPFFRENTSTPGALSNALMTQVATFTSISAPPEEPGGFDVGDAESHEDLFIFTVAGITLAKGERAIVPLRSVDLPYERLFTLDVPFAPPDDLASWVGSERQQQIAEMMDRPAVRQVLRITNTSDTPITTAPALIVRGNRPVAQNLIGYTPVGAAVDVEMTAAVDVGVQIEEYVTGRLPKEPWRGGVYTKVQTENTITLLSRKEAPITVEVTRYVLGFVDKASDGGTHVELTPLGTRRDWRDQWWWSFRWPYWWARANGFSAVTWTVRLAPHQPTTLTWSSHYFTP